MSLVGALLGLVRRRAGSDDQGGHAALQAWTEGRSAARVAWVRQCSVCGGDPRHLCRRCREAAL